MIREHFENETKDKRTLPVEMEAARVEIYKALKSGLEKSEGIFFGILFDTTDGTSAISVAGKGSPNDLAIAMRELFANTIKDKDMKEFAAAAMLSALEECGIIPSFDELAPVITKFHANKKGGIN